MRIETARRPARSEILNTDRGTQSTSEAITGVPQRAGTRIRMDAKGRYLDNVCTDRLWRTVRYD